MHCMTRHACVRLLFTFTATAVACPLFAQTSTAPATVSATATAPSASDDVWRYSLGFGVMEQPKYIGSSSTKFQPAPLVGVSYGRYFLGSVADGDVPFGLGAYLYKDEHWRLGAALTYDMVKPRQASDDSRLHGLPDIDRTAHGTLFANYNINWITVVGALSQDIAGKHEGMTVALDVFGRYKPSSKWTLAAGPGLTWGSSEYNQTFFGVNSADSARSGLAAYAPGSGISSLRFTASASYVLEKHWGLGARVVASKLSGTAGDSPVVESKTQMTYGVFANYLF